MHAPFSTCPKCQHVRQPHETAAPDQCPACGLYFAKWVAREQFVPRQQRQEEAEDIFDDNDGWRHALGERLSHIPEMLSTGRLYGNVLILLLLTVWGFYLFSLDYRDGEINFSFMHNILLAIHEAGHVLFMPFGEFMTILGGSLFQVLMPLICAATLLWQNRDPFGAGVGVWWAGISIMDVAPYIYDAKEPQLMLLGGHTGEDGPHDWIYLLDTFNRVQHSQSYGATAHTLGLLVMLAGLAWSAYTLLRWHRHLKS